MKAIVLAALMAVMAAPATMAQDTSAGVIRPVRLMTVTNNSDGVTRQFFGQVVVDRELAGIDDSHIHAGFDAVV